MKIKKFLFVLAPLGVAAAITMFLLLATWVASLLHVRRIGDLLPFLPGWLVVTLGALLLLTFFPIFVLGFIHLGGPRGAIGKSPVLVTKGLYRYVRNPMYAGISFTILGLGLLLDSTGVAFVGLFWLFNCAVQCRREEKELAAKFGAAYLDYKAKTPSLFPRFGRLLADLLVSK